MEIRFPFGFNGRGRTAEAEADAHLRQLIEQVLFTYPGERVNRPDFGSGLMQLVFAPSGEELATAAQFLVQGALQRWLGDRIQVEDVAVEAGEGRLTVQVRYAVSRTGERRVERFEREAVT
jgi:phage baseplate assembly protein W